LTGRFTGQPGRPCWRNVANFAARDTPMAFRSEKPWGHRSQEPPGEMGDPHRRPESSLGTDGSSSARVLLRDLARGGSEGRGPVGGVPRGQRRCLWFGSSRRRPYRGRRGPGFTPPGRAVGWPGGIAPPGSHRSRREGLPSPGSCHLDQQNETLQAHWAKSLGYWRVIRRQHALAFRNARSRRYFLRSQRIK